MEIIFYIIWLFLIYCAGFMHGSLYNKQDKYKKKQIMNKETFEYIKEQLKKHDQLLEFLVNKLEQLENNANNKS